MRITSAEDQIAAIASLSIGGHDQIERTDTAPMVGPSATPGAIACNR
jgi:hypothetical protein